MMTSRDTLLELSYVDVAPEIGERLQAAHEKMNSPGSYSAFAELNSIWQGHNMQLIGLDSDEDRTPALFLHHYERTPFRDKVRSAYRSRRFGLYDGAEEFRWTRNDDGSVTPIERVASFTGKLIRLPDLSMRTGVFEINRSTSRFGKVQAYTQATAEMFDPETYEPLVEVYDLSSMQ